VQDEYITMSSSIPANSGYIEDSPYIVSGSSIVDENPLAISTYLNRLATQGNRAFSQKYWKRYPCADKSLASEIDDLLRFYQVNPSPKERKNLERKGLQKAQDVLGRKLRTTNLIERVFAR